jgi:hypothetical protein
MLGVDDLRVGWRFLAALPPFLRTPFTIEEARADIDARFAHREASLIALVQSEHSNELSPYRRLFLDAGITCADAEELVSREGVEGALGQMMRAGVYLSGDEFKGRTEVRRGSMSFTMDTADLVNPSAVVHGLAESSGSRGARTPVPVDLRFIRDHAINTHLTLNAHGGSEWVHAHYGVPGGTSVTNTLEFAKGGNPPAKWFTPVSLSHSGLHPRYRLGARVMRVAGTLAGVPLPGPTFAPLDDPRAVARWMCDVIAEGRTPHLWTFASSCVLVCQAASAAGMDLRGARFTAGGEPTTAARRRIVEDSGATILPRMGSTETDILSYACAQPNGPDDMHFFHDRHALIQPGAASASTGLPANAMLLTSLLPSAPIRMINVCMGDQATLETRSCGCAMERLGWSSHVRDVRSFEKLTAGGITFLDVDVIRVLEQLLPARFGGAPTDYQLVEIMDGEEMRPRVDLIVHPRLPDIDDGVVSDFFLSSIGGGRSGERLMELQWRGGNVMRVRRAEPRRTASGKILHVHSETWSRVSDRAGV